MLHWPKSRDTLEESAEWHPAWATKRQPHEDTRAEAPEFTTKDEPVGMDFEFLHEGVIGTYSLFQPCRSLHRSLLAQRAD
jgi:hypothetical protein